MCQTVFSRLESHHDSTCSIDQTPGDVQVLRQHDLEMIRIDSHDPTRGDLKRRRSKIRYLSSDFELDDSAHGAVGVDGFDESRVAVQSLEHMERP